MGKFIEYLRQSRLFADKTYVISHNSRGYDAQIVQRMFLELRWTHQLIMDSTKILSMVVESLHFLDSLKPNVKVDGYLRRQGKSLGGF